MSNPSSAHSLDSYESSLHENVTVKYRPAPIFKRTLAYVIDIGIVSVALYTLFMALVFVGAISAVFLKSLYESIPDESRIFINMLILMVVLLGAAFSFEGYFVYFELKKSQTPGKKLFGLQVIPLNDTKLTLSHVARRAFMRSIDCYLIIPGLISMLLSERKQRIGDLIAGTMVIHSVQKESQQNFIYLSQTEYDRITELLSQPASAPPPALTSSVAEASLARLFPYFILRQNNPTLTAELEPTMYYHFPALLALVQKQMISSELALRYFSQKCFQLLNQ